MNTGGFAGTSFGGQGVSIGGTNNDGQLYTNYDHLDNQNGKVEVDVNAGIEDEEDDDHTTSF